jgi:hypothetical protein
MHSWDSWSSDAIGSALGGSSAEHLSSPVQQLVLPAGDLGRVYLLLGGKLGYSLLTRQ